MKPVQQTIYDGEHGNCHAACVASIFELPLHAVPNFQQEGNDFFHDRLIAYFKPRGWAVLTLSVRCAKEIGLLKFFDGAIGIGDVPSRRLKGKRHSVVVRFTVDGCEVLHDPCSHVQEKYRPYQADEVEAIDLFVRLDPAA